MKFTFSWLLEHLDTEASLEKVSDTLTALGLEVESITNPGAQFPGFIVGSVIKCERHPNADRLQVCVVDTGSEQVQIICGASNVRAGMKAVYAPSGSIIPATAKKLKKTKIRGVESNGMLCSEYELNLSDDHEGIIELPDGADTGADIADWIEKSDPVIEIAITPNRQDCLGVDGIARDLAAAGLGKVVTPAIDRVVGTRKSPINVHIAKDSKPARCPYFVGRYIAGVNNGPSPAWLQKRLQAVGLRPISALVDITNFITFDRGRPLHVFDADYISGDLEVRTSRTGETILALDDQRYTLEDDTTVISDSTGPLSLGGLIGGQASGCSSSTKNVFVEAALFDTVITAAAGRRHGIQSDARYRFERGVDPDAVITGMEAATRMITELCGGEVSDLVIAGTPPVWQRVISFRVERVQELVGIRLDRKAIVSILERLGFLIHENGQKLDVSVPSWRRDIDGEADLVEEVARIHGYEKIPTVSLSNASIVTRPRLTQDLLRRSRVRRVLAARGLNECITWSFIPKVHAENFGGGSLDLTLLNPISSDLNVMRPSILPNLVEAASRNEARGFSDQSLFEVGPQYLSPEVNGQEWVATCIRFGRIGTRDWRKTYRECDLYDAKADATASLDGMGVQVEKLRSNTDAPPWYHPGRSGTLVYGSKKIILANFGELHPRILKRMDVAGPIVGAEVFLDQVSKVPLQTDFNRGKLRFSDLPAVNRDFSFLVDSQVLTDDIIRAIQEAGRALIVDIKVFDIFSHQSLGENKKAVGVAVQLRPEDKTLTDSKIESISNKIVRAVERVTGGSLRN